MKAEKQVLGIAAAVILPRQYPYDVESGELIQREMTSFMGLSGYPEQEYWVTADIWESIYESLAQEESENGF